MRSSNQIELTAGLFLALAIAALVFLALQATDRGVVSGGSYDITATFSNVGGLKPKAEVSLGGVTVGLVERIELDPVSFNARVHMQISDQYSDLPEDTSAAILTAGILGDQYVGLEPGGSPVALEDGDELMITNSAMVLEQLISKYLLNGDDTSQ